MSIHQKLLPAAILTAILLPAHAGRAADSSSWEGAWSGKLGTSRPWPISVTISQAKVVSFSEKGVPLEVSYSKINPSKITFGDQVNYRM